MARAVGTVVGAAVGDALGAPFEFGPAGAFSGKYPPGLVAVTGGLAGAVHGVEAIPARWTEVLHVPVPGWGERVLRYPGLVAMAQRLVEAATQ